MDTSSSNGGDDAVNESPRERGRVLLKRNPIASEYQTQGALGLGPGSSADAEGVDFRSLFRLPPTFSGEPVWALEAGLTLQGRSGKAMPGYGVEGRIPLGDSGGLQVSAERAQGDRIIEHYEAAWREREAGSGESYYFLDRPRYSRDLIETTNDSFRWRLDQRVGDSLSIAYQGLFTQYDDTFYRNRMEFQFSGGVDDDNSPQLEGNSASALEIDGEAGKIRRYFGETLTDRKFHRHNLELLWETDDQALAVSGYYGKWVNHPLWYGWNFYNRGLDLRYEVDDAYTPEITVLNGVDLQDTARAEFNDFRIYDTETTDVDYAARVDFDQRLHIGGQRIWISTGYLHRSKERDNEYSQEIFLPNAMNPFSLDAVDKDAPGGGIVKGAFTLPRGLHPGRALAFFDENRESHFVFNQDQSIISTAQNRYRAEETVDGAYLLAYQRIGNWRWEIGLRQEWTQTATLGTVTATAETLEGVPGDRAKTITVAGTPYDIGAGIERTGRTPDGETVAYDIFIQEVPAENRYENLLPALSLAYESDRHWAVRGVFSRFMMRPQYFDIVRYRRISYPTQTISEGNPQLSPTTIDNFAVALDYDSAVSGFWSVEVYYKRVRDFFYGSSAREDLLDPLSGEMKEFSVSRVENGDSGWIRGFQVQWAEQWEAPLPVLDSIDVRVAYTYSESEATFRQTFEGQPVEDTTVLPDRARHLANASVALKAGAWRVSTRASFLDRTLDGIGEYSPGREQDDYREAAITWDHTLSYDFAGSWRASLSLRNLLNHPERGYTGDRLRVTQNQYSFYLLQASLSGSF